MFVPHRQNCDVMQRPYEYVRTIYGIYVEKLDDPCTFLLNQTESETARIVIACEVLTIIVLYGLPISWRNFIDLSKGRQRAFMSLSIEVWVIRVRSMYLIGTRRSTLAVICDPNSSMGVCANVVLLELCTLSQDSF